MINSILGIILVFILAAFNYLLFKLIDTVLKKEKSRVANRVIASLLNTCLILIFIFANLTSFLFNIIVLATITLELMLMYKEKFIKMFLLSSFVVLHTMAIRAVVVAVASIILNISYFEVVNITLHLLISTLISFSIAIVIILLTQKFIAPKPIRIIENFESQYKFLTLWSAICSASMIIDSIVYSAEGYYAPLNFIQITFALTILFTLYIVMINIEKNCELMAYKEKSIELESEINYEKNTEIQ